MFHHVLVAIDDPLPGDFGAIHRGLSDASPQVFPTLLTSLTVPTAGQ